MKGKFRGGMPLYPKPGGKKRRKGKKGQSLTRTLSIPKEGLADPSLRKDIGKVRGLAPV